MIRRRLGAAFGAGLAAVLLTAAPAAADPARPTNYRSEVTGLDPTTATVHAEVVGGDSFLALRVEPGHEVVVEGYQGEPYLRFSADGTVAENTRSPAVTLNRSRYGEAPPLDADPTAAPEWLTVGSGGEYAWHDHRIHWMSPTPPDTLGPDGTGHIDDWAVALVVDGSAVTVRGTLSREAPPAPMGWLAVAAVVAVVLVAGAWRPGRRVAVLAAGTALVGAVALIVTVVGQRGVPPGVADRPALVALAAIALLSGLAALVRRRSIYATPLVAGAALTLPLWVGLQWGVLTHAVPVTPVSAVVQRSTLAAAIGVVLACALIAVVSEARTLLQPLDDDGPVAGSPAPVGGMGDSSAQRTGDETPG